MIGSHSAEEIAISAKSNGFRTLVFCQKGREKYYSHYNSFLYDEVLVLENFSDITYQENINILNEHNSVLIPNRSLTVYLGYDKFEKLDLRVYGNRNLQRIEDRNFSKNQNWLMNEAGMRQPQKFNKNDIPQLAIVKVQQKNNPLERAFFYVNSSSDFEEKSNTLIEKEIVDENELRSPLIEEFVLGPRFNANFHGFALKDHFKPGFEFVGFDDRVQANLQGFLNLPAKDQLQMTEIITNEEIGHKPVTMRESKKILVYEQCEKYLNSVAKHFPPSQIGMFALQGAINNSNEFVIFDISPRVPGAPILGSTSPELKRLSLKYTTQITSPLDLSMIEIKFAVNNDLLEKILT